MKVRVHDREGGGLQDAVIWHEGQSSCGWGWVNREGGGLQDAVIWHEGQSLCGWGWGGWGGGLQDAEFMWMGLGGREVACRMQSFGMKVRVHVGGLGRIGREVACRMQSFGMKVRVHVGGAGEDREGGGLQDAVIWHEGQSSCGRGWGG